MAVVDDAKLGTRPFLVGHSMGGFVAMVAASRYGDRLLGAILVDSPIRSRRDDPPPAVNEPSASSAGWSFQRMTPYADFETAKSRFRLLPPQPTSHPFLVDYVAERSVREDSDGFTWKFDPRVFERASTSSLREYFVSTRCRLAIVRGAESVVLPRETAESMAALLPGRVPLIEIPGAHHHLMFEEPLALLVSIRSLLAVWDLP
jgi:pimeloyl-ACP methyl ester carboxylesterase